MTLVLSWCLAQSTVPLRAGGLSMRKPSLRGLRPAEAQLQERLQP